MVQKLQITHLHCQQEVNGGMGSGTVLIMIDKHDVE